MYSIVSVSSNITCATCTAISIFSISVCVAIALLYHSLHHCCFGLSRHSVVVELGRMMVELDNDVLGIDDSFCSRSDGASACCCTVLSPASNGVVVLVVFVVVLLENTCILLLAVSATYTLPDDESTAISAGNFSVSLPSPAPPNLPHFDMKVPLLENTCILLLAVSATYTSPS